VSIRTCRHKGLAEFFATGTKRGIRPEHAGRLRILLGSLDSARELRDLKAPGWGLHELQGAERGTRALKVSSNWRLTFRWFDKDVTDVDYLDYH
jgi:proteic killer suppression protein